MEPMMMWGGRGGPRPPRGARGPPGMWDGPPPFMVRPPARRHSNKKQADGQWDRARGAHGIVPTERPRVTARHAHPCCAAASLTFFFCAVVCRVGHTGSWPSLQRPSWRPPPLPAPSVRRSRHAPRPWWSPLPRHDGAHVPWAHGALRQRPTLHGRVSLATRTTECLTRLSGWPPLVCMAMLGVPANTLPSI